MTVYRTSSANIYDAAIRNIGVRLTDLSALQENLTAGKRVVRASDDPTSAAIAERALTRISRIATDQRALASQKDAITVAESTLGSATDAMQRFRELVVSAGNGAHSTAERKSIANELQGLRDQVFAFANTKDTNGQPLFGAIGSALQPFVGPVTTAPDYTFNGLPGQNASTAETIPFALDGDSAFMLEPSRDAAYNVNVSTVAPSHTLNTSAVTVTNASLLTGDTYTLTVTAVDTTTSPGNTIVSYDIEGFDATGASTGISNQIAPAYPSNQPANIAVAGMAGLTMTLTGSPVVGDSASVAASVSVFSVMDDAIRDIGAAANNNASSQAVSQALHNIDISMERMSAVRGQAGELLNRADRISSNQENRSIQLEGDRSRAEDLDMVKGISDFNNQQTGYSAALQTYASIQKLSLFNYIS